MDWAAIIGVIIQVIMGCINKEGREKTRARLRNPGPLVAWTFRKTLRKQGLRGRRLRTATAEGLQVLADMTDAEIDDWLDDASSEIE